MKRNPLGKLYPKLLPDVRRTLLKAAIDRDDVDDAIRLSMSGACRVPSSFGEATLNEQRVLLFQQFVFCKSRTPRPTPEVLAAIRAAADAPRCPPGLQDKTASDPIAESNEVKGNVAISDAPASGVDSTPIGRETECDWHRLPKLGDYVDLSSFKESKPTSEFELSDWLDFENLKWDKGFMGKVNFEMFMEAPWLGETKTPEMIEKWKRAECPRP